MTREAELRKGCGKPVLNLKGDVVICCGDNMDDRIDESGKEWFLKYRCPTCQAELKGITETNSKWKQAVQKAEKLLDDCMSGGCDRELVHQQFKEIFGELTNQSQQIDVEGKPMIPPTPKTSGKDNLVTADTKKGCGAEIKYKYSNTPNGEIKEKKLGKCGDKKGFPNGDEILLCAECKSKEKTQ